MNISRMDDDTIRCVLTAEDLEENGLNLDDFFHNSEHARAFLQTIVERAKEEVGYEFGGGALAMQVMPLPQNGLLITFSEKTDSFLKGLSEHLKDLFQLDSEEADDGKADDGELDKERGRLFEGLLKGLLESRMEKERAAEAGETQKEKKPDKKKTGEAAVQAMPDFLMYRFDELDAVERFAFVAQTGRFLKSSVYYLPENGQWYLLVWRGRTAEKTFKAFCAQALEYGSLVTDNSSQMGYLREHGECILEKDALKHLKELL